jgi:hypothetical protein
MNIWKRIRDLEQFVETYRKRDDPQFIGECFVRINYCWPGRSVSAPEKGKYAVWEPFKCSDIKDKVNW